MLPSLIAVEDQMRTTQYLTLLFLLIGAPVRAQDTHSMDDRNVEFGDVVVCDTQGQVERYVALYHGDKQAAVHAVNRAENDPTACGVTSAVFVRGPQTATARTEGMAFKIVRILVLGLESDDGFRQVQPAPYFTAFGVTEYPV
jgi:hypothetical protein